MQSWNQAPRPVGSASRPATTSPVTPLPATTCPVLDLPAMRVRDRRLRSGGRDIRPAPAGAMTTSTTSRPPNSRSWTATSTTPTGIRSATRRHGFERPRTATSPPAASSSTRPTRLESPRRRSRPSRSSRHRRPRPPLPHWTEPATGEVPVIFADESKPPTSGARAAVPHRWRGRLDRPGTGDLRRSRT